MLFPTWICHFILAHSTPDMFWQLTVYRQCCTRLQSKGVPIITMGCLKSRENENPGMPIFTGCVYFHDTGKLCAYTQVVCVLTLAVLQLAFHRRNLSDFAVELLQRWNRSLLAVRDQGELWHASTIASRRSSDFQIDQHFLTRWPETDLVVIDTILSLLLFRRHANAIDGLRCDVATASLHNCRKE